MAANQQNRTPYVSKSQFEKLDEHYMGSPDANLKKGHGRGFNKSLGEDIKNYPDYKGSPDSGQLFNANSILPSHKSRQRQSDLMAASAD